MKRLRSGFTVVELMIVLGVMMVLAALLYPRFQSVIKERRALQTLELMRHIAEGVAKLYDDCGVLPADDELTVLWSLNGSTEPSITNPAEVLGECWQGPYFTPPKHNDSGHVVGIPIATSEIYFHISNEDLNNNGIGTELTLQVDNIPADIALVIERKVDGPAKGLNKTGKWTCPDAEGATSATEYVTCYYILYESGSSSGS